jgi:sugar phosphate isomerase/epimerase
MIAVSTSCKSELFTDGRSLLRAMERFGTVGIELEYRISQSMYRQMRGLLPKSPLKVVSIHNYFPCPSIKPGVKASGDYFLLSSPDKDERKRAIQWTLKSIEHAADLNAGAVVLHCGCVEMDRELDTLYRYYRLKKIHTIAARQFIARKIKERDRIKPIFLDSLLISLEALVEVAEKRGIKLAVENRYHYNELPTLDDFEVIFAKFRGGPIGYWHDTGHAHANEALTIIPPGMLLQRYCENLIGVHIHDAVGLDDHLPPGSGQIDFNAIKFYLKKDTLKVLELKPGTADAGMIQGIRYVRELGLP